MENEVKCCSQKKNIFRKAVTTLWVPVDCVLFILKAYFVYEKCFPDIEDSNDIKKGEIRRVNRIICKEKQIFIDFQKMIPRFLSQVFTHFDIHLQKRLYMATLRVAKKILRVQNKNSLLRICQECSGDHFGMSHEVIRQKLTRGNAKNQKNTKTV